MTVEQEKLAEDNIALVYHIFKSFGKTRFVTIYGDDIIGEGIVGLVKAAKNFDPTRNLKFATYAARCIRNEMLMFFRKGKKWCEPISLEDIVCTDDSGNVLRCKDIIAVESNIAEFEREDAAKHSLAILQERINAREAKVIAGITAGQTQVQIAGTMGLSQSYVSRLIKNIRKKHSSAVLG